MIKQLLLGGVLALVTTMTKAEIDYAIIIEAKCREIPVLHDNEPRQWCSLVVLYKGDLYPIKKRFHLPVLAGEKILLEG